MKKLSILMVCFAALAFVGCSSTSSSTSSTSAARTAGVTCGKAMVNLYNSYKSTGSIDMNNGVNLTNCLAVLSGYKQLKNNKSDATYRSEFSKGMVSAGSGLITSENVSTVVDKLCNSTGLSNVNATNIKDKAESVMNIINIMKTLNE